MKKRIALGVVAALAGGLLAAAPASAAATLTTVNGADAYRAGTSTVAGNADATITVVRKDGSSSAAGPLLLRVVSSPDADLPAGAILSANNTTYGVSVADETTTAVAAGARTFTFETAGKTDTLTTAGTYSFTAFVDANRNTALDAGEESVAASFVLGGAVDSAVVSLDKSAVTNTASESVTALITYTDASGRATLPGPDGSATAGETLSATATPSSTATDTAAAMAARLSIGQATQIGSSNVYRVTMAWTSATTAGGSILLKSPSTLTTNSGATLTVRDTSAATVSKLQLESAAGLYSGTAGSSTWTTTIPASETSSSAVAVTAATSVTSFLFKLTATAEKAYKVTTSAGVGTSVDKITAPTTVTTLKDGTVVFSVAVATPAAKNSFTVEVTGTSGGGKYTVTYADKSGVWTLTPATSQNLVKAASVTVSATLKDNFGNVLASAPYTISVTGRNVYTATGTTDAAGKATYTLKDSATTSYTTAGSDTVKFTWNDATYGGAEGSIKFTYVDALAAVGTVTVTKPAVETVSIDMVEAVAGEPNNEQTWTVTIRKADGTVVGAGLPVEFSAEAGVIFYGGVSTAVTDANGQATVKAYRQKAGYLTMKATANGVSGMADPIEFVNSAADRRYISVSAAQSVVAGGAATVVATVTDRWGNPVAGVDVTFATSGAGRWVTGETSSKKTDAAGKAQVQVTSLSTETGANTVTATIAGGQSANLAGYVGSTAVAGVTAGVSTASSTVTFTAAPAAAADPTVTALVTQVQSLIVSVNAIIASMTRSITATNNQIAKLVKAINTLVKRR